MRIETRPAYQRGLRKCKKRHWNLDILDQILMNFVEHKGFTSEEIIKYKDHALEGEWKGHREFHPLGRHHDWVVIYHVEQDTLILDDIQSEDVLVLDDTGSHDEVFGNTYFDTTSIDF